MKLSQLMFKGSGPKTIIINNNEIELIQKYIGRVQLENEKEDNS